MIEKAEHEGRSDVLRLYPTKTGEDRAPLFAGRTDWI